MAPSYASALLDVEAHNLRLDTDYRDFFTALAMSCLATGSSVQQLFEEHCQAAFDCFLTPALFQDLEALLLRQTRVISSSASTPTPTPSPTPAVRPDASKEVLPQKNKTLEQTQPLYNTVLDAPSRTDKLHWLQQGPSQVCSTSPTIISTGPLRTARTESHKTLEQLLADRQLKDKRNEEKRIRDRRLALRFKADKLALRIRGGADASEAPEHGQPSHAPAQEQGGNQEGNPQDSPAQIVLPAPKVARLSELPPSGRTRGAQERAAQEDAAAEQAAGAGRTEAAPAPEQQSLVTPAPQGGRQTPHMRNVALNAAFLAAAPDPRRQQASDRHFRNQSRAQRRVSTAVNPPTPGGRPDGTPDFADFHPPSASPQRYEGAEALTSLLAGTRAPEMPSLDSAHNAVCAGGAGSSTSHTAGLENRTSAASIGAQAMEVDAEEPADEAPAEFGTDADLSNYASAVEGSSEEEEVQACAECDSSGDEIPGLEAVEDVASSAGDHCSYSDDDECWTRGASPRVSQHVSQRDADSDNTDEDLPALSPPKDSDSSDCEIGRSGSPVQETSGGASMGAQTDMVQDSGDVAHACSGRDDRAAQATIAASSLPVVVLKPLTPVLIYGCQTHTDLNGCFAMMHDQKDCYVRGAHGLRFRCTVTSDPFKGRVRARGGLQLCRCVLGSQSAVNPAVVGGRCTCSEPCAAPRSGGQRSRISRTSQ